MEKIPFSYIKYSFDNGKKVFLIHGWEEPATQLSQFIVTPVNTSDKLMYYFQKSVEQFIQTSFQDFSPDRILPHLLLSGLIVHDKDNKEVD
jgi:hypothetical protein